MAFEEFPSTTGGFHRADVQGAEYHTGSAVNFTESPAESKKLCIIFKVLRLEIAWERN